MEKFSYEANGYNRQEVNQFVSDVIVKTEDIIKKCKAQGEMVDKLKANLSIIKKWKLHYKRLFLKLRRLAIILREWQEKNGMLLFEMLRIMLVVCQ